MGFGGTLKTIGLGTGGYRVVFLGLVAWGGGLEEKGDALEGVDSLEGGGVVGV